MNVLKRFWNLLVASLGKPKTKEQDEVFVWIKNTAKEIIAEYGSAGVSSRVFVRRIGLESSRSVQNTHHLINLLRKYDLLRRPTWRRGKCYLDLNTAALQ